MKNKQAILTLILVILVGAVFLVVLSFKFAKSNNNIGNCWFSYCYLSKDACMDLPFYDKIYKGNLTDCEKLESLCNKISSEDPKKIGLFCIWDNSTRTCQCYSILDKIFSKYEYTYRNSTTGLVYYERI